MKTTLQLVLATCLATSFAASASAHNAPLPPRAQDYVAHYDGMTAPSFAADGNLNMAGTRGRLGLGANPAHPEGPGNVSN